VEGPEVGDRGAGWRWCLVIGNDGGGKEMVRSSGGRSFQRRGAVMGMARSASHSSCRYTQISYSVRDTSNVRDSSSAVVTQRYCPCNYSTAVTACLLNCMHVQW